MESSTNFIYILIALTSTKFHIRRCRKRNIAIFAVQKCNGGLAQLARAFDWQSKGHRFDSDILH